MKSNTIFLPKYKMSGKSDLLPVKRKIKYGEDDDFLCDYDDEDIIDAPKNRK